LTKAHIDKRDLLTVAVLSIVFFSVATWNLGMAHTPVTTEQFSAGQGFYVDLGASTTVKSVVLLLKDGSFNLTLFVGSPDNWQVVASNVAYPYDSVKQQWSEEYYKWYEVSIQQTTRCVKFTFKQSPYNTVIAEMAVIGQSSQQIPIASINNSGSGNPTLLNLIDEQDKVQYPATYMSQTYFDEIYFVRTAEQYLHLQIPFEWTHPPLGKLIQASGILVFGYNPLGWRIMGVLFAMLMIPVMYFLGKKLFGTWIGAFTSAFLLTFDFMHFTMGRMGTADTYVVFFSLLSQLFFLIYFLKVAKNGWKTSVLPLLLAILFFALGFSTKWLVLYGFLGQLTILLALRLKEVIKLKDGLSAKISAFFNRPFFQLYFFLLLAILVYFLTFIPDMLAGRSLVDVLQLQGSMYIYHSTLNATHPFASPWFSWPFMWSPFGQHVPLWLYASHLPANIVSTIVLMGNPAVWWVGFAFLILAVKEAVRTRDFACIFITVFFFFQWLPYVFISRITFIYHFYVNVPFLCLVTAYFLNKYWSRKWGKAAALAYFAGVVVVFWLFYPAISGTPTPTSSIDSLKWLGSWVF
jgi:dolichyl-phosphate-mannose--protein O-mannosyl transferase